MSSGGQDAIPLAPVERSPVPQVAEPPYQIFVLSSLAAALGAGFVLATLVPLSVVLDWGWGRHYTSLIQAHGQVQLLGWLGLFIMGMAYRLLPRFSGRPLAFPVLVWASWATLSASLIVRLAAQPAGADAWQRSALVCSGVLGFVAAAAFALVIFATVAHPGSRAGATAYFFVAGALAFFVQAGIGLALLALAAQRGEDAVRPIEAAALLHLQLYGFVAMFLLGVASRAVPTFSGLPRPELQAKALALGLTAVVAVYVVAALWIAAGTRNTLLFRLEAASFAGLGSLFLAAGWLVGIFRTAANRLRPASQQHVWFIRTAFGWLVIAGGLSAYYGVRAAFDGVPVSYDGIDAVRHSVGVGVASTMILGMGMLVLPEFAIRRMRHPSERALPLFMLALLIVAAALRVAAAMAAPHWLSADVYWPMAVAGMLAELAIALFGATFVWAMVQGKPERPG
jgi:hypothetical protein